MALPIWASCNEVTLTSWPMGTEPMVVGCQRFKGRTRPGASAGSSMPVLAPKPKRLM
jgi:hypothetical protein